MSWSGDDYELYKPIPKISSLEEKAWSIYCYETRGDMDVRDFWWELSDYIKKQYISKAGMALVLEEWEKEKNDKSTN